MAKQLSRDLRIAIELAKVRPAWQGLQRLTRPVDTLILGDSVARINLSAAQWHAMGLGDVLNLGNTGVSGLKCDYDMLTNYVNRFGLPKRVVIARHIGAYLDDLPLNWRQPMLEPIATGILKRQGMYPDVPVVNDVRPPGYPADEANVREFVRLAPRWLMGPFAWSPLNLRYAYQLVAEFSRILAFIPGPACSLVEPQATAMRDDFGKALAFLPVKFLPQIHIYQPDQMQDPNHLAPEQALAWSRAIAMEVKRL